MNWALDHTAELLANPNMKGWMGRWLQLLKEEAQVRVRVRVRVRVSKPKHEGVDGPLAAASKGGGTGACLVPHMHMAHGACACSGLCIWRMAHVHAVACAMCMHMPSIMRMPSIMCMLHHMCASERHPPDAAKVTASENHLLTY